MQSYANSNSASIIKLKLCSKRQQNESVAIERYSNTNKQYVTIINGFEEVVIENWVCGSDFGGQPEPVS